MKQQLGAWLFTLLVALQAVVAGAAGYAVLDAQSAGVLPPGMRIGSMEVGSLAPERALALVSDHPEEAGVPGVVRIVLPDASYPLHAESLKLIPNRERLLPQLEGYASQTRWARMLAGFSSVSPQAGPSFSLPLTCDRDALVQAAEGIASVWNREAKPAVVSLQGESLVVEDSLQGRVLDTVGFVDWFLTELESGPKVDSNGLALRPSQALYALSEPMPPADAYADMRRAGSADVLMMAGGAQDARQAASMLSGRLLMPGEGFSLRAWINEGGVDPKTGDALSRLATAVFRALLPVRNMTVKTRVPSPYATNYAPPGQEAVLLSGMDDLAMRNDGDMPVLLMAVAEGDSLRVLAFSRLDGASGTVFSDVTETTEPPLIQSLTRELPPGDVRVISPGRAGIQVSVYRVDAQGKTFLHADQYPPQNRILEVGMQPDPRLAK